MALQAERRTHKQEIDDQIATELALPVEQRTPGRLEALEDARRRIKAPKMTPQDPTVNAHNVQTTEIISRYQASSCGGTRGASSGFSTAAR